jgi:outer membrane protein assembly factor BamB
MNNQESQLQRRTWIPLSRYSGGGLGGGLRYLLRERRPTGELQHTPTPALPRNTGRGSKWAVTLAAAMIMFCVAGVARAQQWPQWRGPNLNGSSEAKNLPAKLDDSTRVWSVDLPGVGAGTPIVWNDRIFLTGLDDQSKKLLATCIDRKDGHTLWQKEVGDGFQKNSNNNLAAPSAITDGKLAWFYYGTGDLIAFDFDGNQKWARNIQKDFGPFHMNWIYGSSPLLYGGKLYIQVLHRDVPVRGPGDGSPKDSYLLAVEPETGKDIWRIVRPNDAREETKESYATPIPLTHDGKTEIIVIGGDCVTAHDPETGKEIWRCGGWDPQKITHWRLVASVATINDLVIACPPKGGAIFAIKDGGSGDVTDSKQVVWKSKEMTSDVCVPLIYNDHAYVLDGDKKKFYCVEPATGKILWEGALPSRPVFRASPTGADGKIYCMNENGDVWVLSADHFEILSTLKTNGGRTRASISLVDGEVIVRAGTKLQAFKSKGPI